MAYQTNNQTAIELYIFARNDRDTMRQAFEPAARNMERKMNRGDYDSALSLKQWERVAAHAAKAYVAEFCKAGERWHDMFSVQDRRDCARELRADFEGEVFCGNGWLDN